MKKNNTTKKLRLDTSKVRVLTQTDLANAAGGGGGFPPTWCCAAPSVCCGHSD
jgi:hypothetical protein